MPCQNECIPIPRALNHRYKCSYNILLSDCKSKSVMKEFPLQCNHVLRLPFPFSEGFGDLDANSWSHLQWSYWGSFLFMD